MAVGVSANRSRRARWPRTTRRIGDVRIRMIRGRDMGRAGTGGIVPRARLVLAYHGSVPAPTSIDAPVADRAPGVEILFHDRDLLAVAKPSGLAVHRGWARDRVTALSLARDAVRRTVFPAHRLDRATSGVLLFALDRSLVPKLQAAFAAGEVDKVYWALVRGRPAARGVVDHAIANRPDGPRVAAQTAFRRLAISPVARCSLVEARPRTGRRHQIRRHLKHLSHPVVGDVRYGKGDVNRHYRATVGLHRLALHAASLTLEHPRNGRTIQLVAPLPADLASAWALLGLPAPTTARTGEGPP